MNICRQKKSQHLHLHPITAKNKKLQQECTTETSHQPQGAIGGTSPKALLADIPQYFPLCPFILPYALHICLGFQPKAKGWERLLSSTRSASCFECSQESLQRFSQESLSPLKAGHLHHAQPQPAQKVRSEPKLGQLFVGLAMAPTYIHEEKPPQGLAKQPLWHLTEGGVGEGSHFQQWKCNGTLCIDLL